MEIACGDLRTAPIRTTAMTVPHYINEHQSDIRAIKRITQARGNFGASPWLARAIARNGFRPSPWLRTIKCPACGDEHIRPCIRVDDGLVFAAVSDGRIRPTGSSA